jgi:hypothetical protein
MRMGQGRKHRLRPDRQPPVYATALAPVFLRGKTLQDSFPGNEERIETKIQKNLH